MWQVLVTALSWVQCWHNMNTSLRNSAPPLTLSQMFRSIHIDHTQHQTWTRQAMYAQCNTEAHSCTHCCRATNAVPITYFECVFAAYLSNMQKACAILHCHLWPIQLYHIFPSYLINGTIFGKKFVNIKLLSETFLIVRRIQQDFSCLFLPQLYRWDSIWEVNSWDYWSRLQQVYAPFYRNAMKQSLKYIAIFPICGKLKKTWPR